MKHLSRLRNCGSSGPGSGSDYVVVLSYWQDTHTPFQKVKLISNLCTYTVVVRAISLVELEGNIVLAIYDKAWRHKSLVVNLQYLHVNPALQTMDNAAPHALALPLYEWEPAIHCRWLEP